MNTLLAHTERVASASETIGNVLLLLGVGRVKRKDDKIWYADNSLSPRDRSAYCAPWAHPFWRVSRKGLLSNRRWGLLNFPTLKAVRRKLHKACGLIGFSALSALS